MKFDCELSSQLEELHFKYERMRALVSCLQHLVSEGVIEVRGLPENTLDYALYEIECGLFESNEAFGKLIEDANIIQ